MRCPRCGSDNPEETKFCGTCAIPLQQCCLHCGFTNPPLFKFCGACGTPLTVQMRGAGATAAEERHDRTLTWPHQAAVSLGESSRHVAERRQLTVMFCDLVNSTPLAAHLDPEDLRDVVRAYQSACAQVIQFFEGYIAQYLGDGLLVYFGFPHAHEDDCRRAVYAALGMMQAIGRLSQRLTRERGVSLAARIGIHTGNVVVGAMGDSGRPEQLALGETPNVAARLQALADDHTVVISAAAYHLVQGWFACQDLGLHALKGVATPTRVFRVLHGSEAQSRLDVAVGRGLTPLVGREQEVSSCSNGGSRSKTGKDKWCS